MKDSLVTLFVYSGNSSTFHVSPFIQSQAHSLQRLGITVKFFPIHGTGLLGYLSNVKRLNRVARMDSVDVIHAHYSLCAMVSVLAFTRKPIICSYMGNDILGEYDIHGKFIWTSMYLIIISVLIQPFIKHAICKSQNTSKSVFITNYSIIPNGVDIEIFKPILRDTYGLKKKVLFLGDPYDLNKNIKLLRDAMKLITDLDLDLVAPYPVPHDDLPTYFNEADVFVLCSIVEGSPNVVKEAMSCNCPIVATEVGDVKWLLGDVDGHFLVKHDANDLANKIKVVLANGTRSHGRERLLALRLDSESVAKKIETIYIQAVRR